MKQASPEKAMNAMNSLLLLDPNNPFAGNFVEQKQLGIASLVLHAGGEPHHLTWFG